MRKTLCIGLLVLLAGAGASPARAQSKPITGDLRWPDQFEAPFGDGLTVEVSFLRGVDGGQNGIYISIYNVRLPKAPEFVLLPELINGSESNFIGVFETGDCLRIDGACVVGGQDVNAVTTDLRATLERYKSRPLRLTYFTQTFNAAQLETIAHANEMLGYHGRSEQEYADARKVLDSVAKSTAVFTLLDYTLTLPNEGGPHVASIKFSFDPGLK